MARKSTNHLLRALLTEAGWSAADLSRAVNALGDLHGMSLRYDRTAVAHWLAGSRPRPEVAGLVAQALSRHVGRLVTSADTGLVSTGGAGMPVASVLTVREPVKRLGLLCRMDSEPAGRAVLDRSVVCAVPPALPRWGTGPRLACPAGRGRRRATEADADRLETMAAFTALMCERYGGAHGRSALALFLAEDVTTLLTAPARPPVRRAVLTGAGHLTLLLGNMTYEVGRPALAQQYHTLALEFAHAAEDRAAYTITLRCMSLQAHRLGDRRQAVAWGNAAVELADADVPHAVRAFAHAGRAVVRAGGGSRRAVADLTAAERHLARATGAEGAFTSYPEAALRYQRAEALSLLGDRAEGRAELEASLTRRPADHHRARALLHARLARALLADHEVEAAVAHAHDFLDHYQRLARGSAHGVPGSLLREFTPYRRIASAKALRERLRATAP
ncbi:hypothetical protein [Streptomyces sp. NPDC053560]|uniref:hypothetical protein n=1 Tax=Streptomyces sp. NPDC053560 TaxID=3365711 RepID=UPI0037CE020C